jgi:hypothetical protein
MTLQIFGGIHAMYASPKPSDHPVWTEMRELLWLFSATVVLSIGAVGVGATLALFWGGLSP